MPSETPRRFTFLLLNRFTLMPFAAAIEPLRVFGSEIIPAAAEL